MSEYNNCPNLEIVRKQLKQYIINQPPVPDCEINYELGYMYDPLYEIKDWYCEHYNIGTDKYTGIFKYIGFLPKNNRLTFNIYCRGYIHDPWNVDKNIDVRGEPLVRPGCSIHNLRMFRDYRECCKNKDWKTFVDKYIKWADRYFQCHPVITTIIRDKIDDDILTKQIRNYYQLDVMNEMRWKTIRRITFRSIKTSKRKQIIDETIICNYKFDIYNGFKFNIYKKTDEFSNDFCYGIYADPMYPFRYEKDVVREQTDIRFKNIYENHPIDAQFCFELYIWILRVYNDKMSLTNTPDDWDLSKF